MRPTLVILALALVGCGAGGTDVLDFGPGFGGHGSAPASSDDAPADDAIDAIDDIGGGGGVGGGVEDAGALEDAEDAAPDVEPEPVEDAAPDVEKDAATDAGDELPEAGPVGPPYENENVRCQVVDGTATKVYTCEGMWGPRWGMVYGGIDGKSYTCTGAPSDSETYRAPCKEGSECRVYRTNDIVYGTCVK